MKWLLATLVLWFVLRIVLRRSRRARALPPAPRKALDTLDDTLDDAVEDAVEEPREANGDVQPLSGDELDLHGVPPRDVGDLVDAFVDDACQRGLRHLRIVHGKGIGALRETVRARLRRHPAVRHFGDAPPPSSWGATVVEVDPEHRIEDAPTSD